MSIKQKPVYICDVCKTEMVEPCIETRDVPHEGCSEIVCGRDTYIVGDQHYCCPECLVRDILDKLKIVEFNWEK